MFDIIIDPCNEELYEYLVDKILEEPVEEIIDAEFTDLKSMEDNMTSYGMENSKLYNELSYVIY